MRSSRLVRGAAGGLVFIALAAPAGAAQRDITKQSCEAAGGTYATDRGVKSCTTVGQAWTETVLVPGIDQYVPTNPEGTVWHYWGGYALYTTYQTTTTQSQLANRPIFTTTETTVVDESLAWTSCNRRWEDAILGIALAAEEIDRPTQECVDAGVFPDPATL